MRSWHFAFAFALASCGGGGSEFSLDPLPACPACGPGHVRGGAVAGVRFGRDGEFLTAIAKDDVEWLTADLAVVRHADVGAPGSWDPSGPNVLALVSAPDGSTYVAEE